MATIVGLSTIYCAMNDNYQAAVICILVSALLDGLDGPIARMLKSRTTKNRRCPFTIQRSYQHFSLSVSSLFSSALGSSAFGGALDSLSDYINFGVSPAILIYLWGLRPFGLYGWTSALIFTVAMGCRLARFNSGIDFNATSSSRNFFMGVPAPQGAAMLALPMAVSFTLGTTRPFGASLPALDNPTFLLLWTLLVSFLLVSRIPTYSSKMVEATLGSRGLIVVFVLLMMTIYSQSWALLVLWDVAYLVSLPFSRRSFIERMRSDRAKQQQSPVDQTAPAEDGDKTTERTSNDDNADNKSKKSMKRKSTPKD
jgi:CDP-diacylglycerol--serine O-phosphatidyltransferase